MNVSAVVWLLWLQFCFFSAILSVFWSMTLKTHAKASQTSQRADLLAPVAKTANLAGTAAAAAQTTANSASAVTTVIASNASYLATISQQPAPTKITASGIAAAGIPAPTSYTQSYFTALSNIVNALTTYTGSLASTQNGIYDALQGANIFS